MRFNYINFILCFVNEERTFITFECVYLFIFFIIFYE